MQEMNTSGPVPSNSLQGIKFSTDPVGNVPIYYSIDSESVIVGHTAQSVAENRQTQGIDPVSAVDFIVNATVCYPYSLFKDIFVVPPGSNVEITPKGLDADTYYLPAEVADKGSEFFWGKRLRECVQQVLFNGVQGANSVKVLYSGGEDARSVVSLLPADLNCELVTFADCDNREVALARRASRFQHHPFTFVQRPQGFYYQDIAKRVRLVGAGRDIRHTHVYGSLAEPFQDADVIIGGYGANMLFKGAGMVNIHQNGQMLDSAGRADVDYPDRPVGTRSALDFPWINRDIACAVDERRWAHHLRLKEFRPRTAGNWHRLWPLGVHSIAYAHHLACLKIGPRVLEPFIDPNMYKIAAEMPDAFRVDHGAFREAFKHSLGWAGWLPTSSGDIPKLGGVVGKQVKRRIDSVRRTSDKIRNRMRCIAGRKPMHHGP